jgi:starch phosphorylase
MTTKQTAAPPTSTASNVLAKLREQYGCGPVEFTGTDNALYERHLLFDNVVSPAAAGPRERFEAFARYGKRLEDAAEQELTHLDGYAGSRPVV